MNVILYQLMPATLIRFIPILALFVVGIIIETKFISRVSLFSNAISLYAFYYPIDMPHVLGYIVNSIVIIGLIAGVSRLFLFRLPKEFYQIGWIGSSFVTAFLILYGFTL